MPKIIEKPPHIPPEIWYAQERPDVPPRKKIQPILIALAILVLSVGFLTVAAFVDLPPNIESLSITVVLVMIYSIAYLLEYPQVHLTNLVWGTKTPMVRTPFLVSGYFIMTGMGLLLVFDPILHTSYEEIHGHKDLSMLAPGISLLIIAQFVLLSIRRRINAPQAKS